MPLVLAEIISPILFSAMLEQLKFLQQALLTQEHTNLGLLHSRIALQRPIVSVLLRLEMETSIQMVHGNYELQITQRRMLEQLITGPSPSLNPSLQVPIAAL